MRVYLAKNLREANKNSAADNRKILGEHGVLMVNMMGSPGCGKTSLLEETLKRLSPKYRLAVIEGDLYTAEDAQRLKPWTSEIVQINTEGACHLEANYIGHLLTQNSPSLLDAEILFIENIGNLVCPAEFDLGEDIRVTLLSVTEGNDKPRKYPLAFKETGAILITKLDLLDYVNFNLERATLDLKIINERSVIFPLSAKTGEGVETWCNWLESLLKKKRK
ncbi:MAG: hydrogenase nickel incorporation protein HypB [Bacillota bacterium]